MKRADYDTDVKLAKVVGVWSNQIARWRKGTSTPAGDHLTKLCAALGVTDKWLFGADESDERARVLADVRRVFGRHAADAVEHIGRLTDHHRTIVSGRIQGWVEALEVIEREQAKQQPASGLPATPFDLEEAAQAASAASDEATLPAGAVAAQR